MINSITKISNFYILLEILSGININNEAFLLYFNNSINNLVSISILDLGISSINLLQNLLLLSTVMSFIIGTVGGLVQLKIKRLLTFSTISHVGFLLLALSLNTENSIQSFFFYLMQYTFVNTNVFMILLGLGYVTVTYRTILNMFQKI